MIKLQCLILEIDKNEILVQNLQSKNKFKINVENLFKSKWINNGEKKFEVNNINGFLNKKTL